MSPEEFACRMREIYPASGNYDEEGAHEAADKLLLELVISFGYLVGADIFEKATKWYA